LNVARFISRIEASNFIAVVGTPLYRQKYENKVSTAGSVVAAEVDLINQRLTATAAEKNTVLPVPLEGDERDSLPPLLRGKVYADFRQGSLYFAVLFDLILTLYRIPFTHPAISDLRESLRGDAERMRWYAAYPNARPPQLDALLRRLTASHPISEKSELISSILSSPP